MALMNASSGHFDEDGMAGLTGFITPAVVGPTVTQASRFPRFFGTPRIRPGNPAFSALVQMTCPSTSIESRGTSLAQFSRCNPPGKCEVPMKSDSTLAHDDVLRRVQGEYLEMPGLRLTEAQARRLWGLDPVA